MLGDLVVVVRAVAAEVAPGMGLRQDVLVEAVVEEMRERRLIVRMVFQRGSRGFSLMCWCRVRVSVGEKRELFRGVIYGMVVSGGRWRMEEKGKSCTVGFPIGFLVCLL